jgi:hypothetical protein
MTVRLAVASSLALLLAAPAWAATTIIDENFDSYADTAAMQAVWTADLGMGTQPQPGPYGILVPNTSAGLTPPYDNPPDLQGKGVNILANINEYNGPAKPQLANLVPTATQSIRLSADLFDNNETHRISVGLRNDTVQREFGVFGSNFIELGFYNTRDLDPVDGTTALNFTGYAYRLNTLFNTDSLVGSGLVQQPNWQNFDLDPALDRPDEEEGAAPNNYTTQADIGPGWHRFTVEIGVNYHKFTLDLFRDGLKNTEATAGVGTPGVDAEVTWMVMPHNDATEPNPFDPYTSLRFGSPSGIANTVESVVDNIKLELIDVVAPPSNNADFNNDNVVDGADFLIWQKGLGLTGQTDKTNGNANTDQVVDAADLAVWASKFGGAPAVGAVAAVPEPATAALAAVAILAGLAVRRRR